ncbi:MAG: hypothetical protein U5J62_05640 [Desulfurivibrio sp.]|nr:hypothetical protein [Desulfurivibrio sp.]
MVGEIAASNEQAQGIISEVNEGLSQIDQVTQTNTANAEEGAAAAEELFSQADHLRGLMSTFVIKAAWASSSTSSAPCRLPAELKKNLKQESSFKAGPRKNPRRREKGKPTKQLPLMTVNLVNTKPSDNRKIREDLVIDGCSINISRFYKLAKGAAK